MPLSSKVILLIWILILPATTGKKLGKKKVFDSTYSDFARGYSKNVN